MTITQTSHEIPMDIYCARTEGAPDSLSLSHKHHKYEIFLLLNGEVNFYLEKRGYRMKAGSLLFMEPNIFHHTECRNPGNCDKVNIHIRDQYFRTLSTARTNLAEVLNRYGDSSCVSFHLDPERLSAFLEKSRALEESLHWEKFGDDILAECLIREILVMLNRLPEDSSTLKEPDIRIPRLVTEIISYIEEHLTGDLSVRAIASEFNRNGQYISHRFKKCLGVPLQQYILHKRIDRSCKYLEQGYPLTEACMKSGFRDYPNYSKLFTKYVGVSPKHYQLESLIRW